MRPAAKVYQALSRLVSYPKAGFGEAAEEWLATVSQGVPSTAEHLAKFATWVNSKTGEEIEEHFSRTFDNSASAALETGWHVFGEAYERGGFLVRMRELLRDNEISEANELPDHLSHVLAVLAKCDNELAREMAEMAAIPAVKKICVSLAANQNPYESVLDAVLVVLNLHVQQPNGNLQS